MDSLDLGNWEGAIRSAARVVEDFPDTPGSGEALRVLARASLQLGRYQEAADAAGRYEELLGMGHARFPEALLLHSLALDALGDRGRSLERLLSLPAGSPEPVVVPARELLRDLLQGSNLEQLGALAEASPVDHPLRGVLAAEYAVSLALMGEEEQAEVWAREVLAGTAGPQEEEVARAILADNLEEILGRPLVLGAILPLSEVSPSLLQYSEWISEGIQVAVEEARSQVRAPIRLDIVDSQGSLDVGSRSLQELEASDVLGIIGPLTRPVLAEVAGTRARDLPIISPSSFLPPEEASGVFSLSGPDPSGARMVARYAWDLGLERVVVLRPRTAESQVDSRAFLEAFEQVGGIVPREVVYDSGATFFQEPFEQVGSFVPDGLFLPLPPRDIELLVPQFTYYGLDTLGIQLLGTSGWTTDEVVLEVDSRHTDGVIASTTRASQDETAASLRFREAYEELFQKSLRSPVPALGHDAAALILETLKGGARTPGEVMRGIADIQDFPGATGNLTIESGRIARQPRLVRIQDHELIYISSRFE
jgi:ABC-type branched-subunit amino acid transport system substrate-binding protein